jgi:hypothetical protein
MSFSAALILMSLFENRQIPSQPDWSCTATDSRTEATAKGRGAKY